MAGFLMGPCRLEGVRRLSGKSFLSYSWEPHPHDLSTSQWPHFQVSLPSGLGFQHIKFQFIASSHSQDFLEDTSRSPVWELNGLAALSLHARTRVFDCRSSLQEGSFDFMTVEDSFFVKDPGDLPDPGIEPQSPALQADSLPSEPPGKPLKRG